MIRDRTATWLIAIAVGAPVSRAEDVLSYLRRYQVRESIVPTWLLVQVLHP